MTLDTFCAKFSFNLISYKITAETFLPFYLKTEMNLQKLQLVKMDS